MPRLSLLLILLLLAVPAWAAGARARNVVERSADGPAISVDAHHRPVGQGQLRLRGEELKRLQRHVSEEELRSQQASRRLREQDRALAQLRHQLQALDDRSSAQEVTH